MKFMMLMIPAVYQGGKKPDAGFVPDPKKVEQMTQFNQELGKSRVIATGGLAEIVAKETSLIDIVNPRLTLEGLRLMYELNRGAESAGE